MISQTRAGILASIGDQIAAATMDWETSATATKIKEGVKS